MVEQELRATIMEINGSKQYLPIVYFNTYTYTQDLIAYCSHLLAGTTKFSTK